MTKQKKQLKTREIKKILQTALIRENYPPGTDVLEAFPPERAINPLVSFFCSQDLLLRWRSIVAAGTLVGNMAQKNTESARIIMRRFMWMLNEESGGVGWGVPETMGEIMAQNEKMAQEYHRILFSYLDEQGNYIDHDPLRAGVLWGIFRLAKSHPALAQNALDLTRPYIDDKNPDSRALAMKISQRTKDIKAYRQLRSHCTDTSPSTIYDSGQFHRLKLDVLAQEVIDSITNENQTKTG